MIIWYTLSKVIAIHLSTHSLVVHLVSVVWTDSLIKLHISSSQSSVFIRQKAERNHADILADIYFEIQPCAWRSKQHFNHRCVVYTCLTCLYCQTPASCDRNWKYRPTSEQILSYYIIVKTASFVFGSCNPSWLWKWKRSRKQEEERNYKSPSLFVDLG